MDAHDAQPSTVDTLDVVAYLDDRVVCAIEQFRYEAATTKMTRARQRYWWQQLAGCVGALETIRAALK